MYNESYGVIYEVATYQPWASMEPFWDLKIGTTEYVEYLYPTNTLKAEFYKYHFKHSLGWCNPMDKLVKLALRYI